MPTTSSSSPSSTNTSKNTNTDSDNVISSNNSTNKISSNSSNSAIITTNKNNNVSDSSNSAIIPTNKNNVSNSNNNSGSNVARAKQSSFGKFLFGGISGMFATCFVQPIDLIKTRMQLSGEGGANKAHKTALHAFINIAKSEGVKGMYRGLSAGLLRQATYTTTRLGVFQNLEESYTKMGYKSNFWSRLVMGMTAGGIGALVGTPAEVALVRMTSDGRLPVAERRNYKNVFDALYRICKEESVLTLWRGVGPTVIRAMILNMAQLGGYSQSKELLLKTKYFEDNINTHFVASLIAGFLSTAVSIPVDITKTRLQTMKPINGKYPYNGTLDCAVKVVKNEGMLALWKGFMPYFLRLGPHTILTFLFLEQLNKRITI